MKLTLTKSDLLNILSNSLGTLVTEVEFTDGYTSLYTHISSAVSTYMDSPDNKIRRIKALRGAVPGMGLADAKWIIENWTRWIAFVRNHNRIPKFHGSFYPSPGVDGPQMY